jgi:hypothetical protein
MPSATKDGRDDREDDSVDKEEENDNNDVDDAVDDAGKNDGCGREERKPCGLRAPKFTTRRPNPHRTTAKDYKHS